MYMCVCVGGLQLVGLRNVGGYKPAVLVAVEWRGSEVIRCRLYKNSGRVRHRHTGALPHEARKSAADVCTSAHIQKSNHTIGNYCRGWTVLSALPTTGLLKPFTYIHTGTIWAARSLSLSQKINTLSTKEERKDTKYKQEKTNKSDQKQASFFAQW